MPEEPPRSQPSDPQRPPPPAPGAGGPPPPPAGYPAPAQYGGQTPPGGWQQPIRPPSPWAPYLASWWSRVGAALLDALIITVPALALYFLVFFGGLGLFAAGGENEAVATGAIIGVLVGFGIFILVALAIALLYAPLTMRREGEHNGQTWGKQIVGVKVVRADGQPVEFGFAALREVVVKWLLFAVVGGFFFSIPTLLDYLWPLWDDENRCLHDMLVDSRVIRA